MFELILISSKFTESMIVCFYGLFQVKCIERKGHLFKLERYCNLILIFYIVAILLFYNSLYSYKFSYAYWKYGISNVALIFTLSTLILLICTT